MPAARRELHELIDRIPDRELHTAQRFLQFLSEESFTPEFAESIRHGLVEANAGNTTVCHDFNDMVEKLLSE